ncbi:MAG: DUF4160 domain-containing protein [Clostridia bacterium]|nr:DUF4160 domain-containing protein [Clostridia bacterium]
MEGSPVLRGGREVPFRRTWLQVRFSGAAVHETDYGGGCGDQLPYGILRWQSVCRPATKVWISRRGGCLLCHNRSRIPKPQLKIIMELIEAHSDLIIRKWLDRFHEISFYC